MAPREPLSGLLLEVVGDVIDAIGDEMAASSAEPTSTVDVRNGRPVGSAGPGRLWSFEFDGMLPVQADTPGQIFIRGRDPIAATVLAVGELDLVLGVREELGESVATARLSLDPWFIYDALRERLADLATQDVDTDLAEQILDLAELDVNPPSTHTEPDPSALGEDQRRAVNRAGSGRLRFVWGPPGTGKTATLAATVESFVDRGLRVLVLAHSNAAVDVAMVRVAGVLSDSSLLANGHVLRLGTPQLDEARSCAAILPDEIIRRREPALIEEKALLHDERRSLSSAMKRSEGRSEEAQLARRLEAIRDRLSEIDKRLRELRTQLVLDANVIGATLSKLVIDDLLWRWLPDVVIVDEASMAGLPYFVALALRGAAHLVCFGDFRQLPPIAVSERPSAKHWFGRDIFQLAGVVTRRDNGEPDPRLATLTLQYRMGEPIADAVSNLAYYGMLRTSRGAAETAAAIAAIEPCAGEQIVVVDTGGLNAPCQRDGAVRSFSRFNPLTAALCSVVAHGLANDGAATVGVTTPYRAQGRLLQSLLRDGATITAATTHRFQGSERDAMIVDLADALPQEGPSRLTGTDPDLSLRLFNVAISRAKGKLILVADLSFIDDHYPTNAHIPELLAAVIELGAPVIDATSVLDNLDVVTWRSSWPELLDSSFVGSVDAEWFDVSLPGPEFDGPWLERLVLDSPKSRLRAPVQVASRYEDAPIDLRLHSLGTGPLVFGADRWVAVGGTEPGGPACLVDSEPFAAALRRLLIPAE